MLYTTLYIHKHNGKAETLRLTHHTRGAARVTIDGKVWHRIAIHTSHDTHKQFCQVFDDAGVCVGY
jgi:hypothetical protein